jgi:hypothetical protein
VPIPGGVGKPRTEPAGDLMARVVDVRTGEIVTTTASGGRASDPGRPQRAAHAYFTQTFLTWV